MNTEQTWQENNNHNLAYQPSEMVDRLIDVLLSPQTAFERLASTIEQSSSSSPLPLEAISIVIIVAIMNALSIFSVHGGDTVALWFQLIATVIGALISWNITSLFFGMIGYAIKGKAPWKQIFILLAYALLPGILIAPLTLIRISGASVGNAIGGFLIVLVWLWSALLFALALKQALQIRSTQLAVLLILPLCLSLLWTSWCFGFLGILIQSFS